MNAVFSDQSKEANVIELKNNLVHLRDLCTVLFVPHKMLILNSVIGCQKIMEANKYHGGLE